MPKVRPAPEHAGVIRESYTVPELAALRRKTPKAMRAELRRLGIKPPGKGRPEEIFFSDLRLLAPALVDSLVMARASKREAEAYRARLGRDV